MKIKELSIISGVVLTLLGAGAGYGQLQSKARETEKEVTEVKEVVKENTEAIDTEENINIRQTQMLENTAKILERIEAKL